MRSKSALLLLLALLAAGCIETTGPDGLKVELTSDRTTFAPGDTFEGRFTIRNTRVSAVKTHFGGYPRYAMKMYDAQDSLAIESPWAYQQIMNDMRLGPWASESYDLGFILYDPMPAGDYRIRALLSGYDEPHFDLNIRVE